MYNAPVLFIIFNRPELTKQSFNAIRNAKPAKLYIAADAPRDTKNENELCKLARQITETIDWPCEVKRNYQTTNLGCGLGVKSAFDWFFQHEEEGIILEDDCVAHKDFFHFATEMLEKYRNNSRILSINGSNLGYYKHERNSQTYVYSRFMNMWGWATWKSRADLIDYSMAKWKNLNNRNRWLNSRLRQHFFDYDPHWIRLWENKFNKVAIDNNFTWDWQWIFFQIDKKLISVVPPVNLVSNIGFGIQATHTKAEQNPCSNLPVESLDLPLRNPLKLKIDMVFEEQCIKWAWCYHKRMKIPQLLLLRLKRLLTS
ncbi:MAG: hypothetical protein EOO43_02995 [Flavobacterium sp.]|nr:MAG: hypothetical protein EOO43_02995 [Flavobacterium sp.]